MAFNFTANLPAFNAPSFGSWYTAPEQPLLPAGDFTDINPDMNLSGTLARGASGLSPLGISNLAALPGVPGAPVTGAIGAPFAGPLTSMGIPTGAPADGQYAPPTAPAASPANDNTQSAPSYQPAFPGEPAAAQPTLSPIAKSARSLGTRATSAPSPLAGFTQQKLLHLATDPYAAIGQSAAMAAMEDAITADAEAGSRRIAGAMSRAGMGASTFAGSAQVQHALGVEGTLAQQRAALAARGAQEAQQTQMQAMGLLQRYVPTPTEQAGIQGQQASQVIDQQRLGLQAQGQAANQDIARTELQQRNAQFYDNMQFEADKVTTMTDADLQKNLVNAKVALQKAIMDGDNAAADRAFKYQEMYSNEQTARMNNTSREKVATIGATADITKTAMNNATDTAINDKKMTLGVFDINSQNWRAKLGDSTDRMKVEGDYDVALKRLGLDQKTIDLKHQETVDALAETEKYHNGTLKQQALELIQKASHDNGLLKLGYYDFLVKRMNLTVQQKGQAIQTLNAKAGMLKTAREGIAKERDAIIARSTRKAFVDWSGSVTDKNGNLYQNDRGYGVKSFVKPTTEDEDQLNLLNDKLKAIDASMGVVQQTANGLSTTTDNLASLFNAVGMPETDPTLAGIGQ